VHEKNFFKQNPGNLFFFNVEFGNTVSIFRLLTSHVGHFSHRAEVKILDAWSQRRSLKFEFMLHNPAPQASLQIG